MSGRPLVIALAALLAACATAQPAGREAAFPAGTTFAWLGTDADGARRNAPADPTRYTIVFEPSGRTTLRLDCNRGSARWERDGATLALSPIAGTKMMCPRGSLDVAYAADLAQVASWRAEGSTMRFRPMPPK